MTDHVCSSVNIGSTKAGINMDAVAMMGAGNPRGGGENRRPGLHRLRQAGGLLQRPRGQPPSWPAPSTVRANPIV